MSNIRILFVFKKRVEDFGADIEGTLMDLAHLPMYGNGNVMLLFTLIDDAVAPDASCTRLRVRRKGSGRWHAKKTLYCSLYKNKDIR